MWVPEPDQWRTLVQLAVVDGHVLFFAGVH